MERLNKRHRFIPNHCNSVQWLKWSLMNIPYVCVLTLKYPTTPPEVWICFILNLFANPKRHNKNLILPKKRLNLQLYATLFVLAESMNCLNDCAQSFLYSYIPAPPYKHGCPKSAYIWHPRVISTRHQDGSHGRCLQGWPNSTWHQMAWPLQGNGWGKNRGTKANNVPQAFQSLK